MAILYSILLSNSTNRPEFTVLFTCSFTFCWIRIWIYKSRSGSRQKFLIYVDPDPDPHHWLQQPNNVLHMYRTVLSYIHCFSSDNGDRLRSWLYKIHIKFLCWTIRPFLYRMCPILLYQLKICFNNISSKKLIFFCLWFKYWYSSSRCVAKIDRIRSTASYK